MTNQFFVLRALGNWCRVQLVFVGFFEMCPLVRRMKPAIRRHYSGIKTKKPLESQEKIFCSYSINLISHQIEINSSSILTPMQHQSFATDAVRKLPKEDSKLSRRIFPSFKLLKVSKINNFYQSKARKTSII